jgi:hypothetical protein
MEAMRKREESSFSEEKEAKRLLSVEVVRVAMPGHGASGGKFFGSFFQKRTPSLANLRAEPP